MTNNNEQEVVTTPTTLFKLGEYEHNGYDDSDFFNVYYDAQTKRVYSQEVGSTRYPSSGVKLPVALKPTLEVLAEAAQVIANERTDAFMESSWRNAQKPQVGADVEFVLPYHPRKEGRRPVQVGEQGVVVRQVEDAYNRPTHVGSGMFAHEIKHYRYGVQMNSDSMLVWVAADKLRVVNPADLMPGAEEIEKVRQSSVQYALDNPVAAYRSIVFQAILG